jgi:outer membrane protein assembly factor BamB
MTRSRAGSICVAALAALIHTTLAPHETDAEEAPSSATPEVVQWTQFRGPNSSGIARDQNNVPVEFGPQTNLRWKTQLPPSASSPCIWADRVFLTGYDKAAQTLEIICLDRGDGKILWRRDVGAKKIEKVHAASTPASGTITTDGQRIYAYFGSRGLLCHDFDGNPVWSIEMPVPVTRNGSGTSPVVAGEVVLLNRDQKDDPHLLAVNKSTGDVVWKHPHLFADGMLTEGYATPILWNDQVILHTHEGIRAIALSDGKPIWQVNVSTTGCSTPVISGNTLFVATWQNMGEEGLRQEPPTFEQLLEHDGNSNGTIGFQEFPGQYLLFDRPEARDERHISAPLRMILGMLDSDQDKELTEEEWRKFAQRFSTFITDHGLLSIRLGGEGDVTETHVNVLEKKNIPEVPSPLAHQGRIYMVKNGGIVTCLDAISGDVLYRKRISASGSYYASPIAVGDHIYLASGQGTVTVLRSGDQLDVIAENDLGERIMATPAAVDETLYVRTNDHLYAFATAAE